MKTNSGEKARYGPRIVAAILLAGGFLGLLASLAAIHHSVERRQIPAAVSGMLSMGFFAGCIPAGVAVWRIKASGLKWAKLLFAIQVPVFSIARFSYEFSTFLSLRVMIGNTTRHIGADIGSSGNLNILPQPLGFLFGINIVAVFVFLYLSRALQYHRRHTSPPFGREVDAPPLEVRSTATPSGKQRRSRGPSRSCVANPPRR